MTKGRGRGGPPPIAMRGGRKAVPPQKATPAASPQGAAIGPQQSGASAASAVRVLTDKPPAEGMAPAATRNPPVPPVQVAMPDEPAAVGRHEQRERARQEAARSPGPASYCALARACLRTGERSVALAAARAAQDVAAPALVPLAIALEGSALAALGDFDAALARMTEALRLDPDNVRLRLERLQIIADLGRPREALAGLDGHRQAMATADPASFLRLELRCGATTGDWKRVFALLARTAQRQPGTIPVWDGKPLDGRHVLVDVGAEWAEALPLLSVLRERIGAGDRITLRAPGSLKRLFERLSGARVIDAGDTAATAGGYEVRAGLVAFGALSGAVALPGLAARPADRASGGAGRVGLWLASDDSPLARGMHLLAERPSSGLAMIATPGPDPAERTWRALEPMIRPAPAQPEDWDGVGQALTGLDLLVSDDGPVASLAGAMGIPAVVIAGPGASWQWGVAGLRSPVWPGVRVVRTHGTKVEAAMANVRTIVWAAR
jgi:tetratricopeptide (TPR) repeat protein